MLIKYFANTFRKKDTQLALLSNTTRHVEKLQVDTFFICVVFFLCVCVRAEELSWDSLFLSTYLFVL